MVDGEFTIEIKVSLEGSLEFVLKVGSIVRSVVRADGKRKLRTLRIPSYEPSDSDESSPSLSGSLSWSVTGGEARVKVVSIGSCVDDMTVEFRVTVSDTYPDNRYHWLCLLYPPPLCPHRCPQRSRPRLRESYAM